MCNFIMTRDFPLPRIQTGAVLGNSYLGILLWGENNLLNISFGCSALWDHRGGMEWTEKINFKDLYTHLQNKDMEKIRDMFKSTTENVPGQPKCPCLVPVGRIELHLVEKSKLTHYELRLADGLLKIFYTAPDGTEKVMEFRLDMEEKGRFSFFAPDVKEFIVRDSYSMSNGALASISIPEPERFSTANGHGFANMLPVDDGFGLFCRQDGAQFSVKFARAKDAAELKQTLLAAEQVDFNALTAENTNWWSQYWKDIPKVGIDNPALEELYWYGLYKFGAMTDESGWPAGLQGPWLEDNSFPPWSGDYHLNINLEMCYWPAYRANRPRNLMPVFKMLLDWKDKLRYNAKCFVGIDDGIMVPHAVDDHGTCMGGFWTGSIDHACAAWVAQMMFDYCDYYSDMEFLRTEVFDFMKGVMRVFQAMITRTADGALELPVSVSPEYGGSLMTAWGKNASFQVAAIHRLAENLLTAAEWLKVTPDPFWQEIREKLPLASIHTPVRGGQHMEEFRYPGEKEIALWDGQILEESHRHHSHLAGICPFDTLDQNDPEWKDIICHSRRIWQGKGMGMWAGWSMAWAAMLNTRLNGGESAELTLEIFKRFYTNEGGNSRHDTNFKGFSFMADQLRPEIMQMDAAMGSVTAIQEMFVHARRNILYVGTIPQRWKNSFVENMPAPGGFCVSGKFHRGTCPELQITAGRDNTLRLSLPAPVTEWQIPANAVVENNVLTISMKAGETLTLKSV